jgi:hypothetical protein
VASDNKAYILLRSTVDGGATVWRMSATGSREAAASFATSSGRTAVDIAVDGTSIVYLIWQDLDDFIRPWWLNTSLSVTNDSAVLGGAPYLVAGAGVGADHLLRIQGKPRTNETTARTSPGISPIGASTRSTPPTRI